MPSTMSRPSCPADVADDQGSHAHVPEPYEDDAEITTDELARFIVQLTDARGQIQRQQERIEELTCSGTAAPTISLPKQLAKALDDANIPTRRRAACCCRPSRHRARG